MPPTLFVEGDRKAVISERITRVITVKTRNISVYLNKVKVDKAKISTEIERICVVEVVT
jgi:hypothetical protein